MKTFRKSFIKTKQAKGTLAFVLLGILLISFILCFSNFAIAESGNETVIGRGEQWNAYNENGKIKIELSEEPINYFNGTEYEQINTSIVNIVPSEAAYSYGYRYKVDTGVYKAYFKQYSADNYPIAFNVSSHIFRTQLVKVGYLDPSLNNRYAILQNVQNASAVVSGNKVIYSGVFAGADVEYVYENSRLKENIICNAACKQALQNNPPSSFGLSNAESYLVWITKVNYQDLNIYNNGSGQVSNFTTEERIDFKTALNEIKYFLPANNATGNNGGSIKIRSRLIHEGENNYLLSGVKVSQANSLETPIIFDPTTAIEVNGSIEINIADAPPIEKIKVNGFVNGTNNTLYLDSVSNNQNYYELYAIDPTQLNFTNATVTVNATAKQLYKCSDWNFSTQTCFGSWTLFKTNLVPGQEYSFVLTADDPGFGEINITNVEHLDENRSFISDIYNEAYLQDSIWSEPIYENEFVRVTFEQNLSNNYVIDIYVRNNEGKNTSIEVYEENCSILLGRTGIVKGIEFYHVILENMNGSSDTFDLKVVNEQNDSTAYLEFDYIHDAETDGIMPNSLSNEDGDTVDVANVDEPAPGDGVYEITGKSSDPANPTWIQCGYPGWYSPDFFDISAYATLSEGITTVNGTEFWIVDLSTIAVYHVNSTGAVIDSFNTAGFAPSGNAQGITTVNGSEFWITDSPSLKVYHVNSTGALIDSFDISGYSVFPQDITTVNGTEFWITDRTDDEVYHVNSTGALIDSFDTTSFGSDKPFGIDTINGAEFWIMDITNREIYHVNRTGALINSFSTSKYTSVPQGMTTVDGTEFWIADYQNDKAYHFTKVVPAGTTIQNMTFYWGHQDDTNWALTTQDAYTGVVWSPDGSSTFSNVTDYTVSTSDIDENYTLTTGLPTRDQLNSGVYVRFIGYDSNGAAEDDLNLDYCYFTVGYQDTTPLIITITNPTNGSTINDDPVYLNATSDENADCEYSTNSTFTYGTGTDFTTTGTTIHGTSLGSLAESTYTHYVKCNDTSGNANNNTNQESVTFTVDKTPPASVTNLTNQSQGETWIYWNWTNPSDADFNESIIYIDNIWKVNTSDNFYNATGLSSSTNHTITVHTKDTTGSINDTDVNNTAATLADTTPPSSITNLINQSQGETWIYWNWTNPSDADFSEAIIYLDGSNVANTSNNYYNATSLSSDTSYTITVHTKDTTENVNDSDVNSTASTLADTTKPSIEFVSPTTASGNYSQYYINANVTASDNIGLDAITINLYNSTVLVQSNTSSTSPSFVNFNSLPGGTYYLNATVNDTSGNSNSTETRTITLDIDAPTVTLVSPENNSAPTSPVTFNYTPSDDHGLDYCELWGNWSTGIIDAVDQEYNETNHGTESDLSSSSLGQSFEPSTTGQCRKIGLYIRRHSTSSPDLTVQIRADNNSVPGTILANVTISNTSVPLTVEGIDWVLINFSDPANLTAETLYWIYIPTVGAFGSSYDLGVDLSGAYARGNAYSSEWDYSAYDFIFKTYVASEIPPWGFIQNDTTPVNGTVNSFSSVDASEGIWKWNIKCYDLVGNSAFAAANWTFTIAEDTTPPASVTNLTNQSQGETWIYWNWTNPSDADFNESIIYIDNIWKVNTSDNFYNATGLTADTSYTITIHTKDNGGNVNDSDVNSTASTLADTTGPVVSLVAPADGYTEIDSANVTFTYNVADSSSITNCSIYVWAMEGQENHNQTNTSITKDVNQTFKIGFNTNGLYDWNITCFDSFGNQNWSETRNMTLSVAGLQAAPGIWTDSGLVCAENPSVNGTELECNVTYTCAGGCTRGPAGFYLKDDGTRIDDSACADVDFKCNGVTIGGTCGDPAESDATCRAGYGATGCNDGTTLVVSYNFTACSGVEAYPSQNTITPEEEDDGGSVDTFTLDETFEQNISAPPDNFPYWSSNQTSIVAEYSPTVVSLFNITWQDDSGIGAVYFESNYSGTAQNYIMNNITASVYNYSLILPAGTFYWKSHANDTANQWNSSDSWTFTIAKAAQTATLNINESSPINYSTYINVTCNGELFRNDANVTSEIAQGVLLGAGNYNYSCKLYENQNYTYDDDNTTFVVNFINDTVNLYLNGLLNQNISVIYPQQVNATAVSDSGTEKLYRNETDVTAESSQNVTLGAGTYAYKANSTGNQNYTANSTGITYYVEVNQSASQVNLTLNGTQGNASITIIDTVDLNCSTVSGDSGATLSLYNNGSLINSGTSPIGNSTTFSTVALYNITCIYSSTQNCSSSSETYFVNVSAAPDTEYPVFSIYNEDPENNTEYVNGASYEFNVTITSTNGTAGLEFDGVNYTASNLSSVFNASVSDLAGGTYTYYWWAYGNGSSHNYNTSSVRYYTVAKAIPEGNLTNDQTWTEDYGTAITIGLVESNDGDGDVTYVVYRDNVSKGTGETVTLAAGTYQYLLNTTGGANYTSNASMDAQTLTINQVAGNVTLYVNNTQANATITQGDSIWLNATLITGDSGNLYLYNNGTLINNGTSPISNLTTFSNVGLYNISAHYTGSENYTSDWSLSWWINVTEGPDGIPPQVSIIYPKNTTYDKNVTELNYTASDETALDSCWYSLNGGATNSSRQDCGTNWTGLTSTEGSNTWTLYVNDTGGNENSSSVTFVVDTIAPDISIISPANTTYNNATILVNISSSGDNTWYGWNGTNISYSESINVTFDEGSNTLYAYANDTAGNENSTSVTFVVDTGLPTVTINSPLNQTYTNATILVNITSNGDHTWFFNGTENETYLTPVLRTFGEGSTTLTAWTNDSANNIGSDSVTFVVDTIAPAISNVSSANETNQSAVIIWQTDEDANSTVAYGVDLSLGSFGSNASFVKNHSISLSGLANNTLYYFNVTSCDGVGNCNSSGAYNFTTKDTTAPVIISYEIDPKAVIIGRNVTLNATASDNVGVEGTFVNITLPNSTVLQYGVPVAYTTNLTGRHNATFFANDSSGNIGSAEDYFIAANPIIFNLTAQDYNASSVNTSLIIYFPGTSEEINTTSFVGNLSIELPDYIFDLLFSAFDESLEVKLNNVNLSLDNGKVLGLDKTQESGYLVTYAINSTYTIANANIITSYSGTSYSNEDYLGAYKCAGWNFSGRSCSGSWEDISSTTVQNKTADTFTFNVTGFSAFSIKQETVPAAPPSGGGRRVIEEIEEVECVESWICTDWELCTNGITTRTCYDANLCGTTEYKPVEEQKCKEAFDLCYDSVLNQDESDIDCGGSICKACDNGKICFVNNDCISRECINGACGRREIPTPVVEKEIPRKLKLLAFFVVLVLVGILLYLGISRLVMKRREEREEILERELVIVLPPAEVEIKRKVVIFNVLKVVFGLLFRKVKRIFGKAIIDVRFAFFWLKEAVKSVLLRQKFFVVRKERGILEVIRKEEEAILEEERAVAGYLEGLAERTVRGAKKILLTPFVFLVAVIKGLKWRARKARRKVEHKIKRKEELIAEKVRAIPQGFERREVILLERERAIVRKAKRKAKKILLAPFIIIESIFIGLKERARIKVELKKREVIEEKEVEVTPKGFVRRKVLLKEERGLIRKAKRKAKKILLAPFIIGKAVLERLKERVKKAERKVERKVEAEKELVAEKIKAVPREFEKRKEIFLEEERSLARKAKRRIKKILLAPFVVLKIVFEGLKERAKKARRKIEHKVEKKEELIAEKAMVVPETIEKAEKFVVKEERAAIESLAEKIEGAEHFIRKEERAALEALAEKLRQGRLFIRREERAAKRTFEDLADEIKNAERLIIKREQEDLEALLEALKKEKRFIRREEKAAVETIAETLRQERLFIIRKERAAIESLAEKIRGAEHFIRKEERAALEAIAEKLRHGKLFIIRKERAAGEALTEKAGEAEHFIRKEERAALESLAEKLRQGRLFIRREERAVLESLLEAVRQGRLLIRREERAAIRTFEAVTDEVRREERLILRKEQEALEALAEKLRQGRLFIRREERAVLESLLEAVRQGRLLIRREERAAIRTFETLEDEARSAERLVIRKEQEALEALLEALREEKRFIRREEKAALRFISEKLRQGKLFIRRKEKAIKRTFERTEDRIRLKEISAFESFARKLRKEARVLDLRAEKAQAKLHEPLEKWEERIKAAEMKRQEAEIKRQKQLAQTRAKPSRVMALATKVEEVLRRPKVQKVSPGKFIAEKIGELYAGGVKGLPEEPRKIEIEDVEKEKKEKPSAKPLSLISEDFEARKSEKSKEGKKEIRFDLSKLLHSVILKFRKDGKKKKEFVAKDQKKTVKDWMIDELKGAYND